MLSFPRLRWQSLRLKIIAWSFVPTAIALVAVGLVSFYAFQQTTRFLLIERNREVVRLMATQLGGELEAYTDILSNLAGSPVFSRRSLGGQQTILKQASNSLVVFDHGVVVTDEHGRVVAAEPERPEILGQDWSNRAYFRELVRTRHAAYSDIMTDGPGGAESIVIAVPISGAQDEFLGMVAGMFRLGATAVSPFYGNIVKLRIGMNDYAHLNTYLVDHNGQVIYHTNSEYIGNSFLGQKPVMHLLSGEIEDEFSEQAPGQQGFHGNAGALRAEDFEGRDIVAYYATIPGTNWGLVSEASWIGLLGFYRNYLIVQSFLFVLGVLIPALVVGYRIRRITEPIYQLKAAAEEVAGGNFGQEIRLHTGDELEELVDQFNHMSMQLSQSYATIQEREERFALVMQGTNDGIWDWNIRTGQVYFSPRWKSMLGYAEDEISNQLDAWRRLIHPEDADNAAANINTHLAGSQSLFQLEHRLRHKDGSYRWILTRGITVRDAGGKPHRMVGSHSDITPRKQAEEALRKANETLEERVKERTRELATLNEISALINRSLDLNEILSDVLDKMLEITHMEFGAAYRLEGDRENEWLSPDEAARLGPAHLFLNPLVRRGISRQPNGYTNRLPLRMSGIEAVTGVQSPLLWEVQDYPDDTDMFEELKRQGIEQMISIPLKVKGKLLGAIQLGAGQARSFAPEELDLLAAIGQQVGVAVENARLHKVERERLQQTVMLEERARLARDLHDSVTQSLYSVTLLAEAAARLLIAGDSQTAAEHLRELRDTGQESLREMRLLIYELRPVALEKSGLADALRMRLEAVEARSGIKTELHTEGVEQLAYEAKEELYHIAQESLNNVLKHAHASRVQVNIRFHDKETCLEIVDDGVGFDLEQATRCGGMGLSGIAERAKKIGGKLLVDSAPGMGTRVRVEVGT